MEVRKLCGAETEDALKLIWETFLAFVAPGYSQQGIDSFYRFIHDRESVDSLELFGAYDGPELKGVIAVREGGTHISCFFVSAEYQNKGVGRLLWEYLKASHDNTEFTVNSSPFAVPIYHKLGFQDTGAEQQKDGIRYTPMKYIRRE